MHNNNYFLDSFQPMISVLDDSSLLSN